MEMQLEILVAVIVCLFSVVVAYLLFGRSRKRRPNILITGLCDSGKTLLYCQLVNKLYKPTHTSMKENQGLLTVGDKTLTLVDVPGHERLRSQNLEKFAGTARGVIFVLDSSTITKEIKDVAEYLYIVLTDPELANAKVPILIACNKQDLSLTKAAKVIQTLLEKELTTVRKTRSGALAGTDGETSQRCQLGRNPSVPFEFSHVLPQRIEVIECSAKGSESDGSEPKLGEIKQWVQSI